MISIQNYIGGKLVAPQDDRWIDNYAPATGRIYSSLPDSQANDVSSAVEAACTAAPSWGRMQPEKRQKYLMDIASMIDDRLEALAEAESIDNGKPVSLARQVDIPRAVSNFRFFAHALTQFSSEAHPMSNFAINYTLRQPVGVAGCISPWNLPLYLFTWKIAPALAAGNAVVAKPSEVTPMTAYLLSKICIDAGLPEGVLNIVHGYGNTAGAAIVAHPRVKAISFTGGTKTGAEIARVAAPMFKKLSLELGGKNPNIIFADCDFDAMLDTTIRSSFSNQGQICLCGSRIYVEQSIYRKFRDAFVSRVSALKVGDPANPDTQLGAIVSRQHMEKVLSYIDLAVSEGGTILTGGKRLRMPGDLADGWYIAPTVIDGLPPECRTNREEIFGPVVTVTPFSTEEEVLAFANDSNYGLSSTIWTSNLSKAHRLAEQIETGIVWINCWLVRDLRTPFGGVKDSGVGREGGVEALRFFTEPKNVCIRY